MAARDDTSTAGDDPWAAIRAHLVARKREVAATISAYPAPITGCDAQYNHLLEQRDAIRADLARLGDAEAGADPAKFIAQSTAIDPAWARAHIGEKPT